MTAGSDYLSVDIEGPHKVGDDIRELGVVEVSNTQNKFFVRFFENQNGNLVTLKSQEVGLIMFAEWVKRFHHPVFVSFNSWDWVHVKSAFDRFGIDCPFGQPGRSVDIKVYFMGLMKVDQRDTNKRQVVKLFPSIQKHTHHALDDATEQAEIFAQMLAFRWDQRENIYAGIEDNEGNAE